MSPGLGGRLCVASAEARCRAAEVARRNSSSREISFITSPLPESIRRPAAEDCSHQRQEVISVFAQATLGHPELECPFPDVWGLLPQRHVLQPVVQYDEHAIPDLFCEVRTADRLAHPA